MEGDIKTYWDFSEKERCNMASTMVESFIDMELAIKGILKPQQPTLRAIKAVEVPKKSYYQVGSLLFDTQEQADLVIKQSPKTSNYDWRYGSEHRYIDDVITDITTVKMAKEDDVKSLASILAYNKEAKEYNDKSMDEFKKASDKMQEAISAIWNDWNACQYKKQSLQKIIQTREDYLKLAKENCTIATNFLKRVYKVEEIREAIEWLNVDCSCEKCTIFMTCPEKFEKVVNES